MVGRISETARATQWACAAASTVAADRILMLLIKNEIIPRICENAGSESAYNESSL
jgi:hypothetical protein